MTTHRSNEDEEDLNDLFSSSSSSEEEKIKKHHKPINHNKKLSYEQYKERHRDDTSPRRAARER